MSTSREPMSISALNEACKRLVGQVVIVTTVDGSRSKGLLDGLIGHYEGWWPRRRFVPEGLMLLIHGLGDGGFGDRILVEAIVHIEPASLATA